MERVVEKSVILCCVLRVIALKLRGGERERVGRKREGGGRKREGGGEKERDSATVFYTQTHGADNRQVKRTH